MATFTWIPNYSASVDIEPAVIRAKFGDGYEQRVGDGINNQARKWAVAFTLAPSDITVIDNFLKARYGVESFDWTPPSESTGKWVCRSWKKSKDNYGQDTLSATFEEVFEP